MSLFSDDLLEDTRNPLFSFEVPGVEGNFALYPPRFEVWKQLVGYGLLFQFIQAFCGVLNYIFIVSKRNTTQAYLFGWAVMIPFVTWLPFQLIEYFEMKNAIVKMVPANIFIAVLPRIIEAMYGTAPPKVEANIFSYAEYYITGSHHIRDPKTQQRIPVTLGEILASVVRFVVYFHLLSLSTSFLMHYSFAPFESPVVFNDFHFNTDLLHPGHLGNSYLVIIHNYFYIGISFEMFTFAENVKGWSVKVPFRNPLWASTSPTDFWGRRWNLVIHQHLKGGAFRPARKFFPASVALVCCFLMSGVIHDFAYACSFYHTADSRDPETGVCENCYNVPIYKLTLFFLWNGMIMVLEKPLGILPPFTWISTYLPVPVISTLVVCTVVPVSHWFTGDWVVGGVYEALVQGLWLVKKLD